MRSRHAQLFVSLGVLGLILFTMVACGGGSSSPTTGGSTPASTRPSGNTPTSFASTATLTVSGGLTGTYTINGQSSGTSEYNQSSSGKQLVIAVSDSSWELSLEVGAYTGPGSYTIDGTHHKATFYSADHLKGWDLIDRSGATLTCPVTVSSDTSTTIQGSPAAHVKGTFSCAKMNSDAPTKEPSIAISNGSFDMFIQKTSA